MSVERSGYCGIWIDLEVVDKEKVYWLVCDNGHEQYFGATEPSLWQINEFRDECVEIDSKEN